MSDVCFDNCEGVAMAVNTIRATCGVQLGPCARVSYSHQSVHIEYTDDSYTGLRDATVRGRACRKAMPRWLFDDRGRNSSAFVSTVLRSGALSSQSH